MAAACGQKGEAVDGAVPTRLSRGLGTRRGRRTRPSEKGGLLSSLTCTAQLPQAAPQGSIKKTTGCGLVGVTAPTPRARSCCFVYCAARRSVSRAQARRARRTSASGAAAATYHITALVQVKGLQYSLNRGWELCDGDAHVCLALPRRRPRHFFFLAQQRRKEKLSPCFVWHQPRI